MLPGITLRPARAADAGFAYLVLERTMKDYAVATWGRWKEVEARTSIAAAVAGLRQANPFDLEGRQCGRLNLGRERVKSARSGHS